MPPNPPLRGGRAPTERLNDRYGCYGSVSSDGHPEVSVGDDADGAAGVKALVRDWEGVLKLKVQQWLDKNGLYVTVGVLAYVKSLVPGEVELLAAVVDTRHSPQGRRPHSFFALTPTSLIACTFTEKKLDAVLNAREVVINTEAIPVSLITGVRREKRWNVSNGETWSHDDEIFTVRFGGDKPDLVIPPADGVDSEEVRQQYLRFGEELYQLVAK